MSCNVSIYLTIGRVGREITVCRLDSPDSLLVREIAQRAYNQLVNEAEQLIGKEDSDVGKVKMKAAWLLKTTLESILPDLKLDNNSSPPRNKKGTHGSLLQRRKASQGREAQK